MYAHTCNYIHTCVHVYYTCAHTHTHFRHTRFLNASGTRGVCVGVCTHVCTCLLPFLSASPY